MVLSDIVNDVLVNSHRVSYWCPHFFVCPDVVTVIWDLGRLPVLNGDRVSCLARVEIHHGHAFIAVAFVKDILSLVLSNLVSFFDSLSWDSL